MHGAVVYSRSGLAVAEVPGWRLWRLLVVCPLNDRLSVVRHDNANRTESPHRYPPPVGSVAREPISDGEHNKCHPSPYQQVEQAVFQTFASVFFGTSPHSGQRSGVARRS
jgi:hypothetical protein